MATSEWIDQIRHGDLVAFNRLVGEHQDGVYRLAYYLLCNEQSASRLVETVFQRAYREAGSYRGGPVKNWLYSLVVRLYLIEATTRNHHPTSLASGYPTTPSHERVQKTIAILPPEQRLALALVDVEGLDYPQAASIAGWPVSTVSARLAQARQSFARLNSQNPMFQS